MPCPVVAECLDRLASAGLHGVTAAAFDTRLRSPRGRSGSAASDIATRLRQDGAQVIEPEGSFLVTMRGPALRPGELERAEAWAAPIATAAMRPSTSPTVRGVAMGRKLAFEISAIPIAAMVARQRLDLAPAAWIAGPCALERAVG